MLIPDLILKLVFYRVISLRTEKMGPDLESKGQRL
jgi:hypothetical protein